MVTIEELFNRADNELNCNTSYPIFPDAFKSYRSTKDLFADDSEMSFYIHIPFCRQLCKFCEYTRFLAGDEQTESRYLNLLEAQMKSFAYHHDIKKIYGFDIGGGTPTALTEENFKRLLQMQVEFESSYAKVDNFEKSIEIGFSTITEEKIRSIAEAGFKRVSAGIQSMNKKLMEKNNRYYSDVNKIITIHELLKKYGILKFNIDVMYGMNGTNIENLQDTLEAVKLIQPEQVTLYETRFNQIKSTPTEVTRDSQFEQYCVLYDLIQDMGYKGRFGQNAFSEVGDEGVSSYLYYRMKYGIPYKGFGVAAQSMSSKGLSYGILKGCTDKCLPFISEITEGDNYFLPKEELAGKYVSIAMYSGSFRLDALARILGEDPRRKYEEELNFLFNRGLIEQENEEIIVTKKGFRYYGAITALFWSANQKQVLLKNEITEDK